MFSSFVTGSMAYGTPDKKSDVDLVVLVSPGDLVRLESRADPSPGPKFTGSDSDPGTAAGDRGLTRSLRFGRLNLIAVTCPIAFAVWVRGTADLKEESPVSRDKAVSHFRGLRVKHGLRDAKS